MIILPLQYDNHRGPDAVGQHKLTFTMDESISNEFNPMQIKKGTQFLVMLIQADLEEYEAFAQETPDETKGRFFKQFHALISDIESLRGMEKGTFKESIKKRLIADGKIKESTKELSLEQLSGVIIKLKRQLQELHETGKKQ